MACAAAGTRACHSARGTRRVAGSEPAASAAACPRSPSTWMKRRSTPSPVSRAPIRSSSSMLARLTVKMRLVRNPLARARRMPSTQAAYEPSPRTRSLTAAVAPSRLKLKTSTSAGVTRVEDVVEEVAVGVDRHAGVAQAAGGAHGLRQLRVQRGLPAQQHQVRARAPQRQDFEPALDAGERQPSAAVLLRVDVAVAAAQVAAGQHVQEHVGGRFA